MMKTILISFTICFSFAAKAEGIVEVLVRSRESSLASMQVVDQSHPDYEAIAADFKKIHDNAGHTIPADLIVIDNNVVIAEGMLGNKLVVNVNLAKVKENERLFIMAHEWGHLELEHWRKLCDLYLSLIPGEVVQEKTDAVSQELGFKASEMSRNNEFEADFFAVRALVKMGMSKEEAKESAYSALSLAPSKDTATHPATNKRIMAIRQLEI